MVENHYVERTMAMKGNWEIHEGFDKEWGTHFALCFNDSLKVCETYQLPTSNRYYMVILLLCP